MAELRVVTLTPELAPACAALELACFPHADPAELLSEADIRASAEVFPEGFFVVLEGDTVVGQGAGIFLDFDFAHPRHRIVELTGEHQCAAHRADGAWYYGTDIAVHPGRRRRGIGKILYECRKELVRRTKRRGIIAGGHIPGFAEHKHHMSAEDYIQAVVRGERYDPTLSFQLQNGFRVVCALPDYLKDEATDSWSALIVWDNPDFRSA